MRVSWPSNAPSCARRRRHEKGKVSGALDAGRFAAVAVTLIGTALVACYLPARRASTVDSVLALRD